MRKTAILGGAARAVWGAICLGLSVLTCAKDIQFQVVPVFQAHTYNAVLVPLAIRVQNLGPSTRGEIVINESTPRIPIDLPTGTVKEFIAYGSLRVYDSTGEKITLSTSRGTVAVDAPEFQYFRRTELLVGGSPGQLGFLATTDQYGRYGDDGQAYVEPEMVPDRASALLNFQIIVLGEGSERMSDKSVDAIKAFVLAGGRLVVPIGTSSAVVKDRRFHDIWPEQVLTVSTLPGSQAIADWGGSPMREPFTAALGLYGGTPSFKDSGSPLIEKYFYGQGEAFLLAFDPFEEPWNRWAGRKKLFGRLSPASRQPTQFSIQGLEDDYRGSTWYQNSSTSSGGSPFRVDPPEQGQVMLILGLFIVCVVPVNFIVLRLMKRSELAWVTSPLISLIFAWIFFASAGKLYSYGVSVASYGLITADIDAQKAIIYGGNSIFVPNAGTFDLKLKGAEFTRSIDDEGYFDPTRPKRITLNPIDVGEVRCPNAQFSSLSFTSLNYIKLLDLDFSSWIHVVRNGKKRLVRISPPAGIKIVGQAVTIPEGSNLIMPSIETKNPQGGTMFTNETNRYMGQSLKNDRVVLHLLLDQFNPGVSIGTLVSMPDRPVTLEITMNAEDFK